METRLRNCSDPTHHLGEMLVPAPGKSLTPNPRRCTHTARATVPHTCAPPVPKTASVATPVLATHGPSATAAARSGTPPPLRGLSTGCSRGLVAEGACSAQRLCASPGGGAPGAGGRALPRAAALARPARGGVRCPAARPAARSAAMGTGPMRACAHCQYPDKRCGLRRRALAQNAFFPPFRCRPVRPAPHARTRPFFSRFRRRLPSCPPEPWRGAPGGREPQTLWRHFRAVPPPWPMSASAARPALSPPSPARRRRRAAVARGPRRSEAVGEEEEREEEGGDGGGGLGGGDDDDSYSYTESGRARYPQEGGAAAAAAAAPAGPLGGVTGRLRLPEAAARSAVAPPQARLRLYSRRLRRSPPPRPRESTGPGGGCGRRPAAPSGGEAFAARPSGLGRWWWDEGSRRFFGDYAWSTPGRWSESFDRRPSSWQRALPHLSFSWCSCRPPPKLE